MKHIKNLILLFAIILTFQIGYSQDNNDFINLLINAYEEYYNLNGSSKEKDNKIEFKCPDEPENFNAFFNLDFIPTKNINVELCKKEIFYLTDSVHPPLKQNLILTSKYGVRGDKKHFGIDLLVQKGDSVYSIFCGKVLKSLFDETYGWVVVIRHYNMSESVYAHLDKILVTEGQDVVIGEPIGLGGNSGRSFGDHLHFELRFKGYCVIDPIVNDKFLDRINIIKF